MPPDVYEEVAEALCECLSTFVVKRRGKCYLMAKKEGGWYPACLLGKEGNAYKVRFIGSDGASVVSAENVRHLFAGRPEEEIPRGLFRKN